MLLCCHAITLKSANQDAKQIHASGDWRGKMRLAFLLLCGLAENVAGELLANQQVLQCAVVIIWSLFTLAVRRHVVFQRNKENGRTALNSVMFPMDYPCSSAWPQCLADMAALAISRSTQES